jgi:hypothetical protein
MKFKEVRNLIVSGLHEYMGLYVVLSNQLNPEMALPFILYSVTAPYIPEGGTGDMQSITNEDGTVKVTRYEQPTCTFSFTICSSDRQTKDGFVLGEDEALDLAEKAQGWFLHTGYEYISGKGLTVVDVANVQERSFLQVDEEARRYGFDVFLRYVRTDEMTIAGVKAATTKRGEDNE